MRRRTLSFVVLVCAAAVMPWSEAEACSCRRMGPPCEEFGKMDAVFRGRVVSSGWWSLSVLVGERRPRLHVLEAFRGVAEGTTVAVGTGLGGADCGYPFESGGEYLVYARRSRMGGLRTSVCARTLKVSHAEEDFAYLRQGGQPGARIYGQVLRFAGRGWEAGSEVKVRATGDKGAHETLSTTEGTFELSGLPPGKYEIRLETPANYTSQWDVREIADRGCAEVTLRLVQVGEVRGRVVDARGQPLAGVTVEVRPLAGSGAPFGSRPQKADERGEFVLRQIPVGRYLLGVNMEGPHPEARHPATFYPGVAEASQAQPIEVGSESAELYLLPVADPVQTRTMKFQVVWPDGSPAEAASVSLLADVAPGQWPRSYGSQKADTKGEVSFEGVHGQRYAVWATGRNWLRRSYCAVPVIIEEDEEAPAVRLVLSEQGTACFAVWREARQPPRTPMRR